MPRNKLSSVFRVYIAFGQIIKYTREKLWARALYIILRMEKKSFTYNQKAVNFMQTQVAIYPIATEEIIMTNICVHIGYNKTTDFLPVWTELVRVEIMLGCKLFRLVFTVNNKNKNQRSSKIVLVGHV